ncbi:hypothetical protein [Thalassotalea aquiviva]|uniref:hypothetical protein n=1 Tax=Thalassotalea aquiviva TaxID=3242415 RepID=UPI00352B7B02
MSKLICTYCGAIGKPKIVTRGSLLIEIILWLLFIVPGITYSLWRHYSRYQGCRFCGSDTMVAVDSPLGKKAKDKVQ